MNLLNVLHIASFSGNIGDNANHNGLKNKMIEFFGESIKFDQLEMREFYQSWNLRDFNSDEFIELANQYNLIIIGGGNFFELKWDYSNTGTTVNITKETLEKINTPIFFFGLGCDVAKGASQQAISKFGDFLHTVTNSNKYLVSVRNDGSYNTIKTLYNSKYDDSVYKVPDGAFFFKTKSYEFPRMNEYKTIGINIAADMKEIRFNKNLTYEEFIEDFAKVINEFLKENNDYQIMLFPHIYSDLEAINTLLNHINDIFRRTKIIVAPCLIGKDSEKYIFNLYKKCELILGMRFHSNVCAIAQEIPTIALASYKKINDLYTEINLNERVININEKGFDKSLKQEIKNTINNLDGIASSYADVNSKIENEADEFFIIMKNWAKKNSII